MNSIFIKKYFLPGFIFESLIIGGGYGTLTWGCLIVFVIPALTIGLWIILYDTDGRRQANM